MGPFALNSTRELPIEETRKAIVAILRARPTENKMGRVIGAVSLRGCVIGNFPDNFEEKKTKYQLDYIPFHFKIHLLKYNCR